MAVTRTHGRRGAFAILAGLCFLVAGCGDSEKAISGFTGGSSSKNKESIPPSVNQTPQPGQPVAQTPPVPVQGPVASAKDEPRTEEPPIREKAVAYQANHRKDPFRSLVVGGESKAELVDLSVVTLVGVAWDRGRIFCAVEDAEGTAFILRKGDRVKNGRVVSINFTTLVASQSILGYTTTVQLTLDVGKDGAHG